MAEVNVAKSAEFPSARVALWAAACALLAVAWMRHTVASFDFGSFTDEYVRLAQGQIPHVDYLTSLPQLTIIIQYLINPGFDDLFLYFNIFNYSLWLLNAGLLLVLCRLFSLDTVTAAACLTLWGASADPSLVSASYNHLGAMLLGSIAILSLIYLRKGGLTWALAIGVLVAVTAFVKPPIGLAAALLVLVAVFLRVAPGPAPLAGAVRALASIALGGVLGSLGAIYILARGELTILGTPAVISEILRQAFLDAGTAKGGIVKVMLHWIPRFKIDGVLTSFPAQAVATVVLYGTAIWGLLRIASMGGATFPRAPVAADGSRLPTLLVLMAAVVLVVAAASARWLVIPGLPLLDDPSIAEIRIPGTVLHNLFAMFCLSVTLAGMIAAMRSRRWRSLVVGEHAILTFAAAAAVAALFAVGASTIDYPPFAGLVLFPAIAYLLGLLMGARVAAIVIAVLALVFVAVGTTYNNFNYNGFRSTCDLPRPGGGVSGVLGRPPLCERFQVLTQEVAPLVGDGTVAWVLLPAGYSTVVGRMARGLGQLFWDTHSPRVEKGILEIWTENPPDFMIIGRSLSYPVNSGLAPGGALRTWIEAHYRHVDAAQDHFIVMQRR